MVRKSRPTEPLFSHSTWTIPVQSADSLLSLRTDLSSIIPGNRYRWQIPISLRFVHVQSLNRVKHSTYQVGIVGAPIAMANSSTLARDESCKPIRSLCKPLPHLKVDWGREDLHWARARVVRPRFGVADDHDVRALLPRLRRNACAAEDHEIHEPSGITLASNHDQEPGQANGMRRLLRCDACGKTRECSAEESLRYTREGWPKCCGRVMALFTETSPKSMTHPN